MTSAVPAEPNISILSVEKCARGISKTYIEVEGDKMFEDINRHRFLGNEAMTSSRIIRLSLAGMILASFVGVGTFYAQSSFASNGRPSARSKTRSGGARNAAKPTIVLVHGAFADGTSWQHESQSSSATAIT